MSTDATTSAISAAGKRKMMRFVAPSTTPDMLAPIRKTVIGSPIPVRARGSRPSLALGLSESARLQRPSRIRSRFGSLDWAGAARRFDWRQTEARADLKTGRPLFAPHSGGWSPRRIETRAAAAGEVFLAHTTSRPQTVQGRGCRQIASGLEPKRETSTHATRLLILIALLGGVKPFSRPSFLTTRLALNFYNRLVNAPSESEGIPFTW
jgi:hypothetical protein